MGIFSPNFDRPGPGVPKDAPKKKGIARYFEMFTRDFSTLWKTSMLLTLCAVPLMGAIFFLFVPLLYSGQVPTIGFLTLGILLTGIGGLVLGPALCAAHTVLLKIVRDEPGFFWHDFKKGWLSCWRQSLGLSTALCMTISLDVASLLLFVRRPQQSPTATVLLLSCILLSLLIFFGIWLISCLQIVYMTIPALGMIKNSLLLLFGRLTRMLPATLLCIISSAIGSLMFLIPNPIFIFVLLTGVPAWLLLWVDMLAWPVIDEVFQLEEKLIEQRERKMQQDTST